MLSVACAARLQAESVPDSSTGYRLAAWPRSARSPDFKLIDTDGRPRALADFKGRVVVVFFGFVHCPDVCSAELFNLALAMKQMGHASERIQVLFITLDPERDTALILKRFVSGFDPRFRALSGTTDQINAAAERFHVEYAKIGTGADYSINHSTSTFVIDTAGTLRLIGAMSTPPRDFAHDLSILADRRLHNP